MTQIWALTDHRPGTANQVLGVSRKTGFQVTEKPLAYTRVANLPNPLARPFAMLAIEPECRRGLTSPVPEIIVSAGRRAALIALALKRRFPRVMLVQMMHPGCALTHFDLVALPRHDHPPARANVIATLGAPHALSDQTLFSARARMPLNTDLYPRPWTLVCVGGNTVYGNFTLADMQRLVASLAPFTQHGGSILMTASRRTPPALVMAAREGLSESYPLTGLSVYHPGQTGDNPYHAWLAQADRVVVTADSVSMISEAAYTGKPVYVFHPHKAAGAKHLHFIEDMVEQGCVRRLDAYDSLWNNSVRLDEAQRVAEAVRQLHAARTVV